MYFPFLKNFKLKKGKKGTIFAWDPHGCDVAHKATWQSHADPRERLRDADVTCAYLYLLVI